MGFHSPVSSNFQKKEERKSRWGNYVRNHKRKVARTEGYEFSECKGPVYRHSTTEPRHIVKFQHTWNKEGIIKYTNEKRNKSHQIIRIQNDVRLLNSSTGTQKTMEQYLQNFQGKKNLQQVFLPAKPSNKYDGIIKVFSDLQDLIEITSNTNFLKGTCRIS